MRTDAAQAPATAGSSDSGGSESGAAAEDAGTGTGADAGIAAGAAGRGTAGSGRAPIDAPVAGTGVENGGAAGASMIDGGPDSGDVPRDSDGCPLALVGFATLEGGTTGGGAAPVTTVTTPDELRACATAEGPAVCRVQGSLTFDKFEEIRVTSDKTVIGAGASAEIVFGGFFLGSGIHNVILRNLTIRDSFVEGQYDEGGDEGGDRDGVQMDTAHNVWIDHVHFRHLGDGMIDSRKDTTLLTVSWNILESHNKAFGIGWTDNVTAQLTIHHNWIHDTVQRNPSTDNVLRAHLFNNLLENIDSYGNYARGGTNMVLQNSVFVGVHDPHYYDTGTLVATGNVYRDTDGRQASTGTSFSFFDPGMFYEYTLDTAAEAEALVRRCAGPRSELGR